MPMNSWNVAVRRPRLDGWAVLSGSTSGESDIGHTNLGLVQRCKDTLSVSIAQSSLHCWTHQHANGEARKEPTGKHHATAVGASLQAAAQQEHDTSGDDWASACIGVHKRTLTRSTTAVAVRDEGRRDTTNKRAATSGLPHA